MSDLGRIDVSLEALRANARRLRTLVAPARTAFVVKANAYGHGLVECARAIEPLADLLCVYEIDEALRLRDAGLAAPILVLGPLPPEELDDALHADVAFTLWDTRRYLHAVLVAARRRHTRARVHVKVNTGVNRLGMEPHDVADAFEEFLHYPELSVEGIFSHLAAAEEIDSPYTMWQLQRFEAACARAEERAGARGIRLQRHLAASAAAMLWPQTRLDLVRIGIALYGLWPSPQTRAAMNAHGVDLTPALAYRAPLVAVREVEAGAAVGYGNAFHAPRAMRIGVVPLGYADGIPRALSNRGAFAVEGVRCPIVGRVCMNMTMLDLTPAPRARVGSTVTLIGSDGDVSVTADDWAAWAETIAYEIVARLPESLARVHSEAKTSAEQSDQPKRPLTNPPSMETV